MGPLSPLEGGGCLSSKSMDGDVAQPRLSSPGAWVTSAKSPWLGSRRDELKIISELMVSLGGWCDLNDCRLWELISAKGKNIFLVWDRIVANNFFTIFWEGTQKSLSSISESVDELYKCRKGKLEYF